MTSIRGTSGVSRPLGVPASKLRATRASALVPNAPVTHLANAAQRPAPMPREMSDAASSVGNALSQLASAPAVTRFAFVKMDRDVARRVVSASMAAIVARVGGRQTLHGFAPKLAATDELGRVNVRFARVYDGVPIFGAEVITHLKGDTVVDITSDALPADLQVDTHASITSKAAMAVAARAFGTPPEHTAGPDLVIAKTDAGYRLAYHITLAAYGDAQGPRKAHYFIDAHSGEELPIGFTEHLGVNPEGKQHARHTATRALRTEGTPALEEGTGNSVYSGQVKLSTTKIGDKYVLRDPTAHDAETHDAHNTGGELRDDETAFTDDNNKWGEASDSPRVRDAIDAQYGATEYLKYLKAMFGRDSLDDKGRQLISRVHVGTNYDNAYWDGTAMNYGDGNASQGGKYLTTVDTDTCGHEVTHGVTESTCGLVYRGESGALNEAGSDIIGAAGFSWYLRGKKDNGVLKDYLLFEDSFTADIEGDAIRYMNDPSRDGKSKDNYQNIYRGSQDNGGVHRNSGIANNFFYLLAAGGTNKTSGMKVEQGLGMEKALRIYYRAHTVYFTPDTTFAQARVACVKAATDLYGADSTEVATVKQAATAVGIPEKAPTSPDLIS